MKHFSLLTVFIFILFSGFGCTDAGELIRKIKELQGQLDEANEKKRKAEDAFEKKSEEEKDALKRLLE